MLVLGSLVILSTIAVEFAYNSHISYELASAERDRLQAYYLARSALNLARLELFVERQLRAQFASLLRNLGGSGVTADPLCKQIPLSTGLLKGLASGALLGTGGGEEGEEGEEEEKKEVEGEGEMVSGAEEFLTFGGDFEVGCDTEERKINLNVFRADPTAATATPGAETLSLYEEQKGLLFSLLSQKEFEPIFKEKPDEIRKVVNSIADWADKDDRINEAPGMSGSSEESEYGGPEYHYKVKNGKYLTVSEILLVAGVGDDLYRKLAPQLTVYGQDNKINLCQASDEVVKAFVFKYAQTTPGVAPINPADEERWTAILDPIRTACNEPQPTAAAVANAVATALGTTASAALTRQITTANRFYRIDATGLVRESQVRISAVVDTQGNPNLWKTLYFRVE